MCVYLCVCVSELKVRGRDFQAQQMVIEKIWEGRDRNVHPEKFLGGVFPLRQSFMFKNSRQLYYNIK